MKHCQFCGASFTRNGASKAQFAARKFCSQACGAQNRIGKSARSNFQVGEPEDTKKCLHCGNKYTRHHQSFREFLARKYCSRVCGYEAKRR